MFGRGAIAAVVLALAVPAAAKDKQPPYWASIASGEAMMRTGPGRGEADTEQAALRPVARRGRGAARECAPAAGVPAVRRVARPTSFRSCRLHILRWLARRPELLRDLISHNSTEGGSTEDIRALGLNSANRFQVIARHGLNRGEELAATIEASRLQAKGRLLRA